MSPAPGPDPSLVVIRSGPASERGWLGLRLALALALDGGEVTVWLCGDGAGWALPLDVRAWMGGDPGRDLDGVIDDAGAAVIVDEASLRSLGAAPGSCREGVAVAGASEWGRLSAPPVRVLAV